MIDFRALSYFLVACEHGTLGAAAQELGLAPSTLSASLKSIEVEFGVPLFRRQGAGLSPRQLAPWLYRAGVPLLLLEDFVRRRIAESTEAAAIRLRVDIRLPFAFGPLNRSINRAIGTTAEEEPLVLSEPVWSAEAGAASVMPAPDRLRFAGVSDIRIEPRAPSSGEMLLAEDPWWVIRRQSHGEDDIGSVGQHWVILPDLPTAVIDDLTHHLFACGCERVTHAAVVSADWPRIIEEHQGAAFLAPASALAVHLDNHRITMQPLDPPLSIPIVASHGDDPISERFAERLRAALAQGLPSGRFRPTLTGRRLRYFNLAHDLGTVSAAARAAGVAQPALSQQLQKLEASIGQPLFERRTSGLVLTAAGAQFGRASALLDKRLRELEARGRSESFVESGKLSLGVLPSAGHHSDLISGVTEALVTLRERHPATSLTIHEASNGTLQDWVMRGRLGLAIVETAPPQVPRLPLNSAEDLCVIVDPRLGLLQPGPVRLRNLAGMDLVMPTTMFGLRQLVDLAARAARIDLRPLHEVDALAVLIAMLMREPIATILPASAVKEEIEHGKLVAHPIVEPVIQRKLFVIYSGDRSLTAAERDLVKLLRGGLTATASRAPQLTLA